MDFLLAHAGHDEQGLLAGFVHPITGPDHLLAAVAVGILATICVAGEPARVSSAIEPRAGSPATPWALPLGFVGGMILGGAIARVGIVMPGVETGIAVSLLVIGVAVALRRAGPTWAAVAGLAVLGAFHGHAHVAEYAAPTSLAPYAIGFCVATVLLHAAGIALATAVARFRLPAVAFARVAGAIVVACGVLKLAGFV